VTIFSITLFKNHQKPSCCSYPCLWRYIWATSRTACGCNTLARSPCRRDIPPGKFTKYILQAE